MVPGSCNIMMRTALLKGGIPVRRARFEERLDAVIDQALHRLHKRMKWAYFRGELREYLMRIGLAVDTDGDLDVARFREIREEAGKLMTTKIQRARRKGYLKDYLRKINMMDILLASHHIRTVKLKAVPSPRRESHGRELSLPEGDDFIVRRFTVVK